MVKLSLSRVLDCLCLSPSGTGNSCFCINNSIMESDQEEDNEYEKTSLLTNENKQLMRLKDVIVSEKHTLAFQLKPKMVMLRVSMHCNGCAKKVEKHISKIEGVTSYKVDLETKMVVVIGDILPFEVLHSVSKVMKNAQLWNSPPPQQSIS